MKKIKDIRDLKIGDLVIFSSSENNKARWINVYLVLGIAKRDIMSHLDKYRDITLINSTVDYMTKLTLTLGITYCYIGKFLVYNNEFLCKEYIDTIEKQLNDILGNKVTDLTVEDIRKRNDFLVIDNIKVPKEKLYSWLLKSHMIDKSIEYEYLNVVDTIDFLYKTIKEKYGNILEILDKYVEVRKIGLNKLPLVKNYIQGNLIIKFTPKNIMFYLIIGIKNNKCYILKIEQKSKTQVDNSVIYEQSILTNINWAFDYTRKIEILKPKLQYYDTGLNFYNFFSKKISKEYDDIY